MAYRNGNYAAFYVDEPFCEGNLGAHATEDFRYYNLLRCWKSADPLFSFVDSHEKNYNVRDGSDWETTLKPRLRERLRNSKNIILFLSEITKDSQALHEELEYGVYQLGLPIIIVYPDFNSYEGIVTHDRRLTKKASSLLGKLPPLRDAAQYVPCVHVPMVKADILVALNESDFTVQNACNPGNYVL